MALKSEIELQKPKKHSKAKDAPADVAQSEKSALTPDDSELKNIKKNAFGDLKDA